MGRIASMIALLALCICACSAGNQGNTVGQDAMQTGGDKAQIQGSELTLVIKGKTFASAQDLSQNLLPDNKGRRPLRLEFESCTFKGKVTFSPLLQTSAPFMASLAFTDCAFEDEVDAAQIQFLYGFSMKNCRFKKQASFQNSTFLAPMAMRKCSFDGDAQFQNALFLRDANFMDCHFFAYTLFQQARFMYPALFGNAIYHQNADFTLVRFVDGAQFDFGNFMGRADFTGSRIEGVFSMRKVQASQIILKQIVALAPIKLLETTLRDSTLTEGAFFLMGRPLE